MTQKQGVQFIANPLKQAWIQLWLDPNKVQALKSTLAMGILAVPFILLQKEFVGVTLALGALAGALTEYDDHPKGRVKTILLSVVCFAFASAFVELLYGYPIYFALALAFFTLIFVLIGGIGERYRGLSFGSLLIVVYTMLGHVYSPEVYVQPVLLSAGNLIYGLISLAILRVNPWRPLEEQLATGYQALASYLNQKSKLFPSTEKDQKKIRNQLAILNVRVIDSMEKTKGILISYSDARFPQEHLSSYLQRFMLLQGLHERAASSHERYDVLSGDELFRGLLEGIGTVMQKLAGTCVLVAECLLSHAKYRHPLSLDWMISALEEQSENRLKGSEQSLELLIFNLRQSANALLQLKNPPNTALLPRLRRDERTLWERFKGQLSFEHPRMRYAIRLIGCFLIGYAIVYFFELEKGEWILLTSLIVCQPSYGETRQKLFQRISGTLSGVVLGIISIQLLPTLAGQLLLMILSAFLFFYWAKSNYAVSVIFVTTFVLALFNINSGQGFAIMLPRMLDTVIGSVLAIIMVRFLWPDWQFKKLPTLLTNALSSNTSYFSEILDGYKKAIEDGDELEYRIARREAHKADNALVMAWRYMQLEPKDQRQFQEQAFQFTYLNHALVSYLSALGAHRSHRERFGDEFLSIAKRTFQQLKCTSNALKGKDEIKLDGFPLLEHIRELQKSAAGMQRQQLILIYNIAEVTEQLTKASFDIKKLIN